MMFGSSAGLDRMFELRGPAVHEADGSRLSLWGRNEVSLGKHRVGGGGL